jgi:hypothetical protein
MDSSGIPDSDEASGYAQATVDTFIRSRSSRIAMRDK